VNRPFYRLHEVKDPIHAFIKYDTFERLLIDSRPVQRLRHVHQLSLNYLVYPASTHKRFEHSLGVAELASRVYDVITKPENVTDEIRDLLSELRNKDELSYWRRVLRMAAFCHDIGHLPFSHAVEKELLPEGWDHERITHRLILSDEMKEIWDEVKPPVKPEHVAKLAVGPETNGVGEFSVWEALLSEIIVGNAFGVDRLDYLLRDSHHTGVSFGGIDHIRLIDCLRILPPPAVGDENDRSVEPELGVELGGLAMAEALLLARYFMFSQVYFHPISVMYTEHLKDFLVAWLDGKPYPIDPDEFLSISDNEVTASIRSASRDKKDPGYEAARRICERDHFRILYQRLPSEPLDSTDRIFEAACAEFNSGLLRRKKLPAKGVAPDFRVLMRDDEVVSAMVVSKILAHIPTQKQEYVFVASEIKEKADKWLSENRDGILENSKQGQEA